MKDVLWLWLHKGGSSFHHLHSCSESACKRSQNVWGDLQAFQDHQDMHGAELPWAERGTENSWAPTRSVLKGDHWGRGSSRARSQTNYILKIITRHWGKKKGLTKLVIGVSIFSCYFSFFHWRKIETDKNVKLIKVKYN